MELLTRTLIKGVIEKHLIIIVVILFCICFKFLGRVTKRVPLMVCYKRRRQLSFQSQRKGRDLLNLKIYQYKMFLQFLKDSVR